MGRILTNEQLEKKSRPAVIALCVLTLRLLENWHSLIHGSDLNESIDLDCTMIVLAVVAIGAEKFTRGDLEPELHNLSVPMPQDRLSPCNLSSIASATGLNRETVRRKVLQLMTAGVLEKERGDGIRVAPEFAARAAVRGVLRAQVDALQRTVQQLRSEGAKRRS